jgi:Flp pilus assembly protein TadG
MPKPARRLGELGRRRRRRSGQAMVEFSLVALLLFLIIFAIIDYAQMFFYENALQNAMREATRFATTGRVIQLTNNGVAQYDTNNGVAFPKAINDSENREASRYGCIRMYFQSNCVISMPTNGVLVVSATELPGAPPVIVTNSGVITLMTSTNTAAVAGPGNASDYVQLTATYNIHTITPLLYLLGLNRGTNMTIFPVRVTAIVKNEPATSNFEHNAYYSDELP